MVNYISLAARTVQLQTHPRRPAQQTAPVAERRPVSDGAALAAPRQVPARSCRVGGTASAGLQPPANYEKTAAHQPVA
jgi:hypothetical protein